MASFSGVVQMNHQPVDPGLVKSRLAVTKYIVPRKIQSWENPSVSVHVAEINDTCLNGSSGYLFETESCVIVADILLFNRMETGKLLKKGSIDDSIKDTEILLALYEKLGPGCLSYIKGDYSFFIYHKKTGDFFCARDPLGIRPFFYAITSDSFLFGSELRFVKASFPGELQTNFEYILNTLVTCKSDIHETAFKSIYRLKPAHYLLFEGGKFRMNRFWQFNTERKMICNTRSEYAEILRSALIKAVQVRLGSADHVGAELSGGLDSSAICGIAQTIADSRNMQISAFSNILPGDHPSIYKDESEYILQQLRYKAMDWTGIERLNQNTVELINHAIAVQGCFTQQNFHVFNKGLLEAAGNKNISVLLSGFGGDEMISARISFPWNEVLDNRKFDVFLDELFYRGITFKSFIRGIKISGKYLLSKKDRRNLIHNKFSRDLLDNRFNMLPILHDFSARYNLRKRFYDKYAYAFQHKISKQQIARITQNYVAQHMEFSYAAAAQYGIEYRYPLLDTELLETYLSFPAYIVNHHGINRYIFRSAIQDFVPEIILSRNDKSFLTIPHVSMRLADDREIILSAVRDGSKSSYLNEIFDFQKFPGWYEEIVKQDEKMIPYLMPGAFCNDLMFILYCKDHA
jgi:asparagine synthase (glutamine-hydrolysing)